MKKILLLCIFSTEAMYFIVLGLSAKHNYAHIVALGCTIFSIVFGPLQAGLSDFYCRRKSLIVSLIATLVGSLIFYIWYQNQKIIFLIIYILLIGIAGNVSPIAIAGFKDITKSFYVFRYFLSLYVIIYYAGGVFYNTSKMYATETVVYFSTIIIIFISIIFVSFLFRDLIDKDLQEGKISFKSECLAIYHIFIKDTSFLLATISFLLAEISLYQITFRTEISENLLLQYLPLELIIGSIIGAIFLKFNKSTDKYCLWMSLYLALASLVFVFILILFGINLKPVTISVLIVFSFCLCVIYSTFISILIRKRHHHDYGKIVGVIESVDDISYFLAILIIVFRRHIGLEYIWLISAVALFLAGILLHRFFKISDSVS
jgi:hypothetical protein